MHLHDLRQPVAAGGRCTASHHTAKKPCQSLEPSCCFCSAPAGPAADLDWADSCCWLLSAMAGCTLPDALTSPPAGMLPVYEQMLSSRLLAAVAALPLDQWAAILPEAVRTKSEEVTVAAKGALALCGWALKVQPQVHHLLLPVLDRYGLVPG